MYLAREESYKRIREISRKLDRAARGDFTGVKSIKTVALYVKEHGSTMVFISPTSRITSGQMVRLLSNLAVALGQGDAADSVRTVQLYDAGKDPGCDPSVARHVLPLNSAVSF